MRSVKCFFIIFVVGLATIPVASGQTNLDCQATTGCGLLSSITTGTGACGATCVGTGANVNMYTYQIPARKIGSGRGVRLKARWTCSTCTTASKLYRWQFGATTISYTATTVANTTPNYTTVDIFNTPGSTTAQTMFGEALQMGAAQGVGVTGTAAEDTANAITVNFIFNAAATETMTPVLFTAQLIN